MDSQGLTFGAAFFGGLISFLSPCVLPLIPGYISMLSGVSLDQLKEDDTGRVRKTVLLNAGAFVIGFSLVFIALGASASWVGSLLKAHLSVMMKIAGIVVVALGLHLIGVLKITALYKEARVNSATRRRSLGGSLLMGLAFAFGWTPCIGPILAGILALAAAQETLAQGVVLLGVYSLGLAIPFLLTALSVGAFLGFYRKFRAYLRGVEVVAGAMLITVGVLIATNNFQRLAGYLPNFEIGALGSSKVQSAKPSAVGKDANGEARLAPDLRLKDINGREVNLASLRGKVVIVDFWATWCPPCREEVPTFKQLQAKYQSRGFELIAIAVEDDEDDVKQFAREHQLNYTVVLGDDDITARFGNIVGLPTTFFIDRAGRIRKRQDGIMGQSEFEKEIEKLLSEPQSKD
jgi:cytochrome c-type biogenesis protein